MQLTTIETYPQLIGYDPAVFDYFREQCVPTPLADPAPRGFFLSLTTFYLNCACRQHLCGYDLNLTYPQDGHFATPQIVNPTDPNSPYILNDLDVAKRQFFQKTLSQFATAAELQFAKRAEDGTVAKRDLSLRANGTIDSWYGCFLYDELIDYALNFSAPWSTCLCFPPDHRARA